MGFDTFGEKWLLFLGCWMSGGIYLDCVWRGVGSLWMDERDYVLGMHFSNWIRDTESFLVKNENFPGFWVFLESV